jgi:uncharacterized phage protein gp47/JayE
MTGVDAHLRRSIEYILARIWGGMIDGLYGYLHGFVLRQIFPDTADDEYFWRWFTIWLERQAAVYWRGTYEFTGVDTTAIPEGTVIQRSDGLQYTVDADVAISGTDVIAAITATDPGIDYNNDVGQTLSLASPIVGVDTDGLVQSTTQTGADVEDRDDGLERLLLQIRQPPSGGGPGDYVRWALEVSGVTRAWEFPNQSAVGSVSVAFVRDDETPITPDAGERTEVFDHIEELRPVTATVEIIELSEVAVPVTLSALSPNTAAVQAAVTTSLEDLFLREAEPDGTIPLSKFNEAISTAAGEESHTLSAPAADVTADIDEINILGTVTFP